LHEETALLSLAESDRKLALDRYRILRPHIEDERTLSVVASEAGIAYSTAQRWVSLYRRFGLTALVRKRRSDRGQRRALSAKLRQVVEALALEKPPLPIAALHRHRYHHFRRSVQNPRGKHEREPERFTRALWLASEFWNFPRHADSCPECIRLFVVSLESPTDYVSDLPLQSCSNCHGRDLHDRLGGTRLAEHARSERRQGVRQTNLAKTQSSMNNIELDHPITVSRDKWLIARKAHLEREKALTRLRDQVAAERRELPWVRIEKEYLFDAPSGKVTLADLFDGRRQLFIKHFMMGPGQKQQCVGCSLEVDHIEGILEHLENHDVSYVAVARAPIEEIEAVRKRMSWRFNWVSSYSTDFNYDFGVSFRPEDVAGGRASYNFQPAPDWAAGIQDLSGDSIFYKDDAGQIFHTYSTYGRGGEEFLGIYRYLDSTPKGRDENGPYHSLGDWARPRNRYGEGGMVEGNGRYHEPSCDCAVHIGRL
jgi:predicted dithiol-disulfide oxidoreductase (DUF899 family)